MTKVVFMGTPAFSAPILRMLCEEGYEVLAVVTTSEPVGVLVSSPDLVLEDFPVFVVVDFPLEVVSVFPVFVISPVFLSVSVPV